MQSITALSETPLNRLFLAINHYVSTGDHFGEGMSVPAEGLPVRTGEPLPTDRLRILVLANQSNPVDLIDYNKFKSRFDEVAPGFNTKIEPGGHQNGFRIYSFVIEYSQCDPLAQALTEKPGPLGWGSMKELIDQHFPG